MKKALLYKQSSNIEEVFMFDEHFYRNVYTEDGESYIHAPGDEIDGVKLFRRSKYKHK